MTALATDRDVAAERCVAWLAERVRADASGSAVREAETDPRGRYWLGRLAPASEIAASALGLRAERLEPCAVGLRFLLAGGNGPALLEFGARLAVWSRSDGAPVWTKAGPMLIEGAVTVGPGPEGSTTVRRPFEEALSRFADAGLAAHLRVTWAPRAGGQVEVTVELVNDSDHEARGLREMARGRLFETSLRVRTRGTEDYLLESLPDSFRYNRRVPAWGINCGVRRVARDAGVAVFETDDLPVFDKSRPRFWGGEGEPPDLSFAGLEADPVSACAALLDEYERWGAGAWRETAFGEEASYWTVQMRSEFETERFGFEKEVERLRDGVELLRSHAELGRSFRLMNAAMAFSVRDTKGNPAYEGWRPFQVGFLLANLRSCLGEETETVDIVWFPTGGGKTETYLGLIITAALFDRIRGKTAGITAWSRFPLRLLSLQQTQRFANALAGAETVRVREDLGGDPFSLGFLIGGSSTPNEIKDARSMRERGEWDYEDEAMPDRLRTLRVCPFCKRDSIAMRFRRKFWRLEHGCTNAQCDWGPGKPLPIHVVDAEVWRYLPTVVVGTLDKAAGIAFQANMRGMVAPPRGFCPEPGHGYTYASRYNRPHGCLHPRCRTPTGRLPMRPDLYGITFRLQDELHLLRDSLGAVDAHYEAVFDHLQEMATERRPKILASSATLSGYVRQAEVLYRREARVFPHPEPRAGRGFWSQPDPRTMRRFLAVAPRGQTIEYAVDRMTVSLQTAIRELAGDPDAVAPTFGVHPDMASFLVDLYGTNVVYGNTLRDLDAVVRSAETQWGDIPAPAPNVVTLTGRTGFGQVSDVLDRLENPDGEFGKRIHVVAASSMMSHGVDVDRLNVMTMLGLPLTTAEFIQATARVGRRWPGLVFVVHKIARERDASVYRAFPQYVDQGDRFVEPVPITGRSRRVLERTLPGLAFARILFLHEPRVQGSLWKAHRLRAYLAGAGGFREEEIAALCRMLRYGQGETEALAADVAAWYGRFAENAEDPARGNDWSNELGPGGKPMLSLRDVEEQVPVRGADPT